MRVWSSSENSQHVLQVLKTNLRIRRVHHVFILQWVWSEGDGGVYSQGEDERERERTDNGVKCDARA